MAIFKTTTAQIEKITDYVIKIKNGGYIDTRIDYFMTNDKGYEGVIVVRSVVEYVEESYVKREEYLCFLPDGTISDCDDLMFDVGVKLTFYRNLVELEPCLNGFCIKK